MKPTNPNGTGPRSRRALLAAAAGAAAATAAASLRPLTAAAADGDPLILGQNNQADTETQLLGALSVNNSFDDPGQASAIYASSLHGAAVTGFGFFSGSAGVVGDAEDFGAIGVLALHAKLGTALRVEGKTQFAKRSGRATVVAGRASVDIDLREKGGLSGTPLCFANLMSYRAGVFVTTVRPNYPVAGKARIYLNRTVSSNAYVAWFVLN